MERFGLVPEDFAENDDIEPVSDPNIFSEAQRYAQLQEQVKLTQVFPDLPWNKLELARRAMQLLKVDGIDTILPKPPEPFTGDPISENQKALMGQQLNATPDQDHIAHIQEHIRVLLDPMLGAGPLFPGPLLQNIMANITQHVVYLYHASAMTGAILQSQIKGAGELSAAEGAAQAMVFVQQAYPQLAQQLTQAAQLVQSKMPQPPMDPAVKATFDAAMAETQRRAQRDQAELQLEAQKLQQAPMIAQMQEQTKQTIAQMRDESSKQIAFLQAQAERDKQQLNAQIEVMKNDADNQQHQQTELAKNNEDNLTQLVIARLKDDGLIAPAAVETPDFSGTIKEMERMLVEIERAKSNDALVTTMESLRAVVSQLSKPKRIIEDSSGKPIGIE